MCLGAQKTRLTETVLLSTNNICFGREIKKIVFQYALLSGGLVLYNTSIDSQYEMLWCSLEAAH